ncbi:MAG TPA: hypothetical protein VMJ10_25740 [Kofleriaceae bacterium]|nr:hypothetical protein [Kofleriaceae bacterium]
MRYLLVTIALAACSADKSQPLPPPVPTTHSSSIALSSDGNTIYVVNADTDSFSIVDTAGRALVAEVPLAPLPAVDGSGRYTPAVMPRALALSPDETTLYVTGERSGMLYAIDLASRAIQQVAVGSEPVGVVVSGDGATIFVACSNDAKVAVVDAASLAVTANVAVDGEPWALGWSPDGTLAVTLFQGPGLDAIDPTTLAVTATWTIPDVAPRGDSRLAHGQVRGLYDVAQRPGAYELWVVHALLGTDTAQPDLIFENTAFPALSIVQAHSGIYETTLSTDAQDIPGVDGSFADVVSGPHAIAFTADGALAIVVDTNSEDLLAVDATGRVEAALGRPLPGHMPEGVALSPDGMHAYVDERNTGDIAIVDIARGANGVTLEAEGVPIARFAAADPMPAQMRLGQHLFYSANSDEYPVTTNHWIACATCHMEGRSDAVTWKFAQGPRDTPTNAGGMLGTGFLFRTADRTRVQDYWHTVNIEQGGSFDPVAQASLLDAIESFVDYGLPLPVPPTTDPTLVARGKMIFESDAVGCSGCHAGARFTDSGAGNPTLDLAGPIMLHDGNALGTCVTTGYPDVAHDDVDGDPRAACMFDTPSLSGAASTPPYLHDGSAPTIHDVLEATRGKMGDITSLSEDDEAALVEYVRSL